MDETTPVNLDLTDSELLELCLIAHEKDLTLNQLVNEILFNHIENRIPEDIQEDNNLSDFRSFDSFDDFVELCNTLYQLMPMSHRTEIDNIAEETFERHLAEVHDGYGRWLRNTLNLWDANSEIVKWFSNVYGLDHADDISSIIIAGIVFRNRISIRNRTIHKLVTDFKEHWKVFGKNIK